MQCVTEKLHRAHVAKLTSFREELQLIARETKKVDSVDWIAQRLAFMEVAWRDQAIEELDARARIGRFCHAFYVEPEYQAIVDMMREGTPSIR